jgi:hypothetical protein
MAALTPAFEELPLDKNGPFGNAWGRFGDRDQLGMLNLLTPESTIEAAKEIKNGVRVSLDWHLSKPAHPFFGRQVFYHHMHNKSPRTVNDDIILFNTQCSTQWDGFRHFGTILSLIAQNVGQLTLLRISRREEVLQRLQPKRFREQ